MRLKVKLFPNSGHHFYFAPLAVSGADQNLDYDRSAVKDQLPNLSPQDITKLVNRCGRSNEWIVAKGGSLGNRRAWLRGRFGFNYLEKTRYRRGFRALGLWCAIETNTGSARDGYVCDIDDDPHRDGEGWRTWSKQEVKSNVYIADHADRLNFDAPMEIDLVEAFELGQIGAAIDECILEIEWLRKGGRPVPVHLVIDFGNSRTIAFGLEQAEQVAQGHLRDICKPILFPVDHGNAAEADHAAPDPREFVPDSWFILREPIFSAEQFTPPEFTTVEYVTEIPRKSWKDRVFRTPQKANLVSIRRRAPHMFVEISPAAFGLEAKRALAKSDMASGHLSFLSSPKRYTWDVDPVGRGGMTYWFMNRQEAGGAIPLQGEMLRFMPKDPSVRFDPKYRGKPEELVPPSAWDDPAMRPSPTPDEPDFARADAMVWAALSIMELANRQIQSEAWRGADPVQRYLSSVVVTFPPGWTHQELRSYWQAWKWARNILFWSRSSTDNGQAPLSPSLGLDMMLDEAVASQLPIVFSEIRHLCNRAGEWIDLYGREREGVRSTRVLTIDIGGGTTDTSVVDYVDRGRRATGAGVRLEPVVLFTDSSTLAGDRLVRDLIEGALLPELGKSLSNDPNKIAQFETAMGGGDRHAPRAERLKRMVVTRSVFMPMVYRWLNDFVKNRRGDPDSQAPWTPLDCDADPIQIGELNRIFEKAGLPVGLLDGKAPFDVDYERLDAIICKWCKSIAEIHAHYVAVFQCDLVVVTGKPSELPQVKSVLEEYFPIEFNRVIFAAGYYAGDWFPASDNFKVPDAKMMTVIGATLHQAIRSNLIGAWQIEATAKVPPARNYWGLRPGHGVRFRDDEMLLQPHKDQARVVLPMNCRIARARFRQLSPEPVYILRWRNPEDRRKRGQPDVEVCLMRRTKTETGELLPSEHLELGDVQGIDAEGVDIGPDDVELHLRTLPEEDGHWLDVGQFDVQWQERE